MFTQTSEKEMTSCLVCGFLLRVGRVCKGYDKPLSGKNFPLEGPIWGVLQDTKMGEVIVLSTPPLIPKQRGGKKRKDSQHLLKKQAFT